MVKTEKMMSPQEVLKGLEKIRADIKAEELTPEGRAALLEQVKEIEALLLEMKESFPNATRKTAQQHNLPTPTHHTLCFAPNR